jgi:hypothetical protein
MIFRFARLVLSRGTRTIKIYVILWNMHLCVVNKLEMKMQILKLFQGVNLVLLTETWHFSSQHLPHVEGYDSLVIVRTVQLGKIKVIKHSVGLLLTFVVTLTQTYHSGRKEVTIFICG